MSWGRAATSPNCEKEGEVGFEHIRKPLSLELYQASPTLLYCIILYYILHLTLEHFGFPGEELQSVKKQVWADPLPTTTISMKMKGK